MATDNPSPQEGKQQTQTAEQSELSSREVLRAYRNLLSLEDSFRSLKENLQKSEATEHLVSEEEGVAGETVATPVAAIQPVCRDTSKQDFVETVDWSKVWLGVRRKLWLVLGCGLIAAAAGSVGSFMMTRTQQATAVVLFTEQQGVNDPDGVTASRFNVQTVAEMIRAPQNLASVREALGLDMDTSQLSGMIDVVSNRTTNLIRIVASTTNPELSVDIANTLAEVSTENSKSRYREHAQDAYGYYSAEEEEARKRLDEYSQAITSFKQQAKVFEMDLENQTASQEASELEREYRTAAIQYEELLVQYENTEREMDRLPDHVVRYEYDDNPLKARISHKEMSLLEARTKYGPENPKVLLLEEEIRQLRMALSDSSFDETREQVYEKNFIKEQLNIEQLRLQGKLRAAQAKKQSLQVALAEQDERYQEVPQEQLEYAALLRRAQLASEEVVRLSSAKRNAESRMERGTSDLQVREKATGASRRSSFMTRALPTLAFALGSFIGLFFVVLSEITDGKVVTPEQLRKLYSVPHLLSVPKIARFSTDTDEKLLFYIRTLSERLSQLVHDKPFGSVVFTSATSKEGKSSLAFHLAKYYKRLGMKTAYVDFSYGSNPWIDQGETKPLNTFLQGTAQFNEVVHSAGVDTLKASKEHDMKELMKSEKMEELWKSLDETYDMVIVDAPGVIEEHFAVNVADRGDLCLYVVGASRVGQKEIDSSLQELEKSGVRPRGIILNAVDEAYIEDPMIQAHTEKKGWLSFFQSNAE